MEHAEHTPATERCTTSAKHTAQHTACKQMLGTRQGASQPDRHLKRLWSQGSSPQRHTDLGNIQAQKAALPSPCVPVPPVGLLELLPCICSRLLLGRGAEVCLELIQLELQCPAAGSCLGHIEV